MKKKIAAIKEYLKYFPNDCAAKDNLLACQYAEELEMEFNDNYRFHLNYGFLSINSQIKVGKKYHLTNSATHYEQNGIDSIVVWNESCGRLAFVSDKYWFDIEDEWNEFMNVLMSYQPLDYDRINNVYIYNVEQGKKLINDYDEILKSFRKKVYKKIKEVDLINKRKELERLQKELEGLE